MPVHFSMLICFIFRQWDFSQFLLRRFREGMPNHDLVGSCGRGIFGISVKFFYSSWAVYGLYAPTGNAFPPLSLNVWSCLQYKLYADMGINAFNFWHVDFWLVCFGTHPKAGEKVLPVTWLQAIQGWLNSIGIFLLSYVVFIILCLSRFNRFKTSPYWDCI